MHDNCQRKIGSNDFRHAIVDCPDKLLLTFHFASPLGLGLGRTDSIPRGGAEIKEYRMLLSSSLVLLAVSLASFAAAGVIFAVWRKRL